MRLVLPALFLICSACSPKHGQQSGSTVTITLPPPKPAATPGFSTAMVDPAR